ncbi:MAG: sirohydrochlorin chelatase [Actinomycetota bacterium]|nr:sirohydrochlorin chelatase [Actinomycetota bacterium]
MTETLIACSHGTDHPEGRAAISGLVQALRREAHHREVVPAFVDVQEPSIDDAVRATHGRRIIIPLLLSSGYHVNVDIARASQLDPMVSAVPPLGPDWILAEIGVRRLFEAGAGSDDTIVLASAGSASTQALDDVSKAARLLSAVWGGRVHVGSIGGGDTPIAEAVDIARAYGRRVVVSTYLLAPGNFDDRLQGCGADVISAPLLDGGIPDPRLVNLVLARSRSMTSEFV